MVVIQALNIKTMAGYFVLKHNTQTNILMMVEIYLKKNSLKIIIMEQSIVGIMQVSLLLSLTLLCVSFLMQTQTATKLQLFYNKDKRIKNIYPENINFQFQSHEVQFTLQYSILHVQSVVYPQII